MTDGRAGTARRTWGPDWRTAEAYEAVQETVAASSFKDGTSDLKGPASCSASRRVTLAAAILDRLLHHGTFLTINGPSYRRRCHHDRRRAAPRRARGAQVIRTQLPNSRRSSRAKAS